MARSSKAKGTKTTLGFVMFQDRMLKHPAFHALSPQACKALLFLAGQFNRRNNGDLTIAWKIARRQGWTSNGSLRLATRELIEAGFVVQTRQGGRNRCSLFGLTWFPIDHCDGKLDVPATSVAPNDWVFKNGRMSEPPTVQCAPYTVQSGQKSTVKVPH